MAEEHSSIRTKWYADARFGMFIHWGLYAIPARGEWVASIEQMPQQDYQKYVTQFCPDHFDPAAWARTARQAGMKYAVLTAKHHDGFCLFDSKLTDYKVTNTPYGRDIVREYLDAFRQEGLKVGLYYSLLDWHHPDYPHYGDYNHPMRNHPECSNEKRDFSRYLEYMHGQVRELCTNYGKLDLLWFDYCYDNMRGETWQAKKLVHMIRQLQPEIMINNRLEASGCGFGSLVSEHPQESAGDFASPEQLLPPEGIRDVYGNPVLWEACTTINNSWGYTAADRQFKPAGLLVHKLVECVSKSGNLLLNVGPNARGEIPPEEVSCLQKIGGWMHDNQASIYGCGSSGLAKPEYGRITRHGSMLYYHVYEPPIGYLPLPGIAAADVRRIFLLKDGRECRIIDDWRTQNYPEYVFTDIGSSPILPDEMDTVVAVELNHGKSCMSEESL